MTKDAQFLLKPCPFCGSDVDNDPLIPFPSNREGTSWVAQCGNPGCAAEIVARTKADAAKRWNRRTP